MEGMLASRGYALNGVLNGVDLVEWDPNSDPHLEQTYDEHSFTKGKAVNKAALQKEMGLAERPEVSCDMHEYLSAFCERTDGRLIAPIQCGFHVGSLSSPGTILLEPAHTRLW